MRFSFKSQLRELAILNQKLTQHFEHEKFRLASYQRSDRVRDRNVKVGVQDLGPQDLPFGPEPRLTDEARAANSSPELAPEF